MESLPQETAQQVAQHCDTMTSASVTSKPQASTLKTGNSLLATAADGVRQFEEASGQARISARKGWLTNANFRRSDNS
jgi:hypothetical protein